MNPPAKRDMHPLAINILKFQRYNFEFFSCEEVVLFEYMMVKGMSFRYLPEFYLSSETIRRETGIRRYAQDTILKKLEQLGILEIQVKGIPRVKYFKVNFRRVQDLVSNIYLLDKNRMLPDELIWQLEDFFDPLAGRSLMDAA